MDYFPFVTIIRSFGLAHKLTYLRANIACLDMSTSRKRKPARLGAQQKTTYPLHPLFARMHSKVKISMSIFGGISSVYRGIQAVYRQYTDTIQALITLQTHFSLFLTPIYGGYQYEKTPFGMYVMLSGATLAPGASAGEHLCSRLRTSWQGRDSHRKSRAGVRVHPAG